MFIAINKEYPGSWHTKLERLDLTGNGAVSVVHVSSKTESNKQEFYATSFYEFKDIIKIIYSIINICIIMKISCIVFNVLHVLHLFFLKP